ncbi:MAG: DUF3617 family protein [Acidobacteriaceae bacterium]|jgi:hypothetical protein
MKIRLAALALPLLLSFAALAQTTPVNPPPIKMGLWQSSVTVNMSGMPANPNMPSGAGGSMTHVNQSCMTPDSWRDAFRNMQQRRQQAASANCSTLNVSQDAHQVTFDMNCSSQQGFNTNIHVQMLLDSEEAMHGNANVKMSGPNFPQGMSMTSVITSKFVSSDCGDVKPGESKPVHP